MSISTLIILALIGLFAGMLSGMIGIGGGIVIVPALVYFLSVSQYQAQGTSILLMLPPIGIMAAYNYHKAGQLNWKFALIIAIAFIIGGYLGSKLTLKFINEDVLKKIFGVIMLLVSVRMLFFSK